MLEILTRLATESVLECKSVCKLWRDVVRLPSFAQMHLTRINSSDDASGEFGFIILGREQGFTKFYYTEYGENCHETPTFREARMDSNPPVRHCYIFGSCNGLICFNSWLVDEIGKVHIGATYVCNLITREYIILPDFGRKYLSWFGFGYTSSTNEYKFVRIDASTEDSSVRIVQVYTLGSGWRTVGEMDENVKQVRQCLGAFANGSLHWLDQSRTVLAFSLTDEKFSEILAPPPCLTRAAPLVLKSLGDFVSVTYYAGVGIETWILKKNKDNNDLSWSKEFTCKYNSHLLVVPFGFTTSGMLLCYENKKIYGYNSKASSAEMDVSFGKNISQAFPHTNTFVSLKVLGEKDTETMEFGERASPVEETGCVDKEL